MGSPYRGAIGELPTDGPVRDDETLVRYDVNAAHGIDGRQGSRGAPGQSAGGDGRNGGDAGAPTVGEDAGAINMNLSETEIANVVRLAGTMVGPSGEVIDIERTQTVGGVGFIDLVAIGGNGGAGGVGGKGGAGSTGRRGSDATKFSSGDNGGTGGAGGDGGDGTSGANGGEGGQVVIGVDASSTHLLMLVRHNVSGGGGGNVGRNGAGGAGGAGGTGGSSHSWTESETRTDSNGNSYSHTTHHYNPGGSRGSSGPVGRFGNAALSAGQQGAPGQLTFAVNGPNGRAEYASRYHLRLVSLEHRTVNGDFVYEPRETIIVSQIVVENVGGMPTPTGSDVHISIDQQGWVDADEQAHLVVPRGLGPGEQATLDGELRFRLGEYKPRHAAAPLEIDEELAARGRVQAVRRSFEDFVSGEVRDQCMFVIRFPLACSAISSMASVAPGQATRVRWTLHNQSGLALGSGSASQRRIRVRLYAIESELGDGEFTMFDEAGNKLAPSSGYSKDVEVLEAGESVGFDISLGADKNAPPHRAMTMRLAVQLGDLEAPQELRTIQLRDLTTRIAPRYRFDPLASMLMITNHKTSAEAIIAWQRAAMLIGARINLWDLTLEGHLDLDRALADGRSLLDHFFGKTIVVLNNSIDTTGGQAIDEPEHWRHPHELLGKADVHAANSARIDIAFVGADPDMGRLLMPMSTINEAGKGADDAIVTAESDDQLVTALATVPSASETGLIRLSHKIEYTDRQWWGGLPDISEIGESAEDLHKDLIAEYPDRRYLVVYNFDPEVESKFLWIKKWKVGEVQVQSCLDPVAGSVAHVSVAEVDVHSPIQILSDGTISTLLLARDFADNIGRLDEIVRSQAAPRLGGDLADGENIAIHGRGPTTGKLLELLVSTMLAELANEQDAVTASRWRAGLSRDEIRDKLPRLRELTKTAIADGTLLPGAAEASHIIELAARLCLFAQSQVKLWEKLPPIRFLRRAPTAAAVTSDWISEWFEACFGQHEKVARKLLKTRIEELEDLAAEQPGYARELVYQPIRSPEITTDDELMSEATSRTISRKQYDDLAKRDLQHDEIRVALRQQLQDSAKELLRTETTGELLAASSKS